MKWRILKRKQHRRLMKDFIDTHDERTYTPSLNMILRPFRYFGPRETQIVIISTEPSCVRGEANGLAFSSDEVMFRPSVLNTIINTLERTITGFTDTGETSLVSWARRGVLLLNMSLTVGKTNESHYDIWEPFTRDVINHISWLDHHVTFMLWGTKGIECNIADHNNTILYAEHPTTAYIAGRDWDCDHFAETDFDWTITD